MRTFKSFNHSTCNTSFSVIDNVWNFGRRTPCQFDIQRLQNSDKTDSKCEWRQKAENVEQYCTTKDMPRRLAIAVKRIADEIPSC